MASQSKIISGGQGSNAGYRGNAKKFVMNNPNQMQMVAEIHRNGPGSIKGQPRAAT